MLGLDTAASRCRGAAVGPGCPEDAVLSPRVVILCCPPAFAALALCSWLVWASTAPKPSELVGTDTAAQPYLRPGDL